MYDIRLFGIVTMNPPVQQIYSNKTGGGKKSKNKVPGLTPSTFRVGPKSLNE
jgi:hypothetical protein